MFPKIVVILSLMSSSLSFVLKNENKNGEGKRYIKDDPKELQVTPTYVYLTFDDGPNDGTDVVLDALKAEGVKATFFINSIHIDDPDPEVAQRNIKSLLRQINEGHVLADHSYDHMAHNHNPDTPVNAYVNSDNDLTYFGTTNADPVISILEKYLGPNAGILDFVRKTMKGIVRMPYTNNWRVPNLNILHNCMCTKPKNSGLTSLDIADKLSKAGSLVFGWDSEWAEDFDINRNKYGGIEAFEKLLVENPRSPKKIVILSHDKAFRPGGERDERLELKTFLRLVKEHGFTFKTLDTYLTDSVNSTSV